MAKRRAILLLNFGGPDNLKNVEPFLYNLFYDKILKGYPAFIKAIVAKILAMTRKKTATEIYKIIGNKSPILEETIKQKEKLEKLVEGKLFIVMRYWHPMSKEVVAELKEYNAEEIFLLPLYPQFSTSTTDSSIKDIKKELEKEGMNLPTKTIGCYPTEDLFVKSHVELIKKKYKKGYRILFSAHGLPEYLIKNGDPYQWQIEQSVKAIIEKLAIENLDYKVTYQSKVGPLKWLDPDTEKEIEEAATQGINLVVVPIAFVSEHSETLAELDIEYGEIAKKHKIDYIRIPALGDNEIFINSMAKMINSLENKPEGYCSSSEGKRLCPSNFVGCICK